MLLDKVNAFFVLFLRIYCACNIYAVFGWGEWNRMSEINKGNNGR